MEPTGSHIEEIIRPVRVQWVTAVLGTLFGLLAGLAVSQYTIGREIASLTGQVTELVKIDDRVKANTNRIDALDYFVGMRDPNWSPPP